MAKLAAHLFEVVTLEPGRRVLDIGAGTGVAANQAAEQGCCTVGIDFSEPMLGVAHCNRLARSRFVCADAHQLPFRSATFDAALAAFCFNETEPEAALAETRRVLKPGGRLAFIEWGAVDPLAALFDNVLAEYATRRADGFQAEMRKLTAAARPWDEMVFSCLEIEALLNAAGFGAVICSAVIAEVVFRTPEAFVEYMLAWPPRRVEVEAMSTARRARFYRELYARLGAQGPAWTPTILRATATRAS